MISEANAVGEMIKVYGLPIVVLGVVAYFFVKTVATHRQDRKDWDIERAALNSTIRDISEKATERLVAMQEKVTAFTAANDNLTAEIASLREQADEHEQRDRERERERELREEIQSPRRTR